MSTRSNERGIALLVAMMALVFMSALGLALVASTTAETLVAANFRAAVETAYAADAMVGRAMVDLRMAADWTPLLTGVVRSTFVDGEPTGVRTLDDGSIVDLDRVVNLADCNKTTACRASEMDAVTSLRPWGLNNPRWQLYAYGPLKQLSADLPLRSSSYVVAMVGDDPSETDGNPLRDAAEADDPGAGVVALRVEAFGPHGAHKIVELTLLRSAGLHVLSWRP
jgi:hypothetical protein